MPKNSIPKDLQERLAFGKRIHEKEWNRIEDAAETLNLHKSTCYTLLREYRDSAGIVTDTQRRVQSIQDKRLATRAANRARKKASEVRAANRALAAERKAETTVQGDLKLDVKPVKTNGNALAHVPDSAKYIATINDLEHELADTKDRLAHITEEYYTLQKIVMAVGKQL